jgi:hypothetical protein
MSSIIVRRALDELSRVRAEYENVVESSYARAVNATNGKLLNKRGQRKGVDAYRLFMGNASTAYAYASEELVEHWDRYPRLTFAEYERQVIEPVEVEF